MLIKRVLFLPHSPNVKSYTESRDHTLLKCSLMIISSSSLCSCAMLNYSLSIPPEEASLLIDVANFTTTFSHFTAYPYAGTGFVLTENGRLVLNIVHSLFKLYHGGDWGGLFESMIGHGLDGSMALLGRVGRGIHTKAVDIDTNFVGKVKGKSPKDHPRHSALLLIKLVILLEVWFVRSLIFLDPLSPSSKGLFYL
ncbi:hypothetical protein Nepgr_009684 [Nepenthes gracilis]|uniref:H(+)-exporting diphosphatase n=1 Tax=Nepenthes gracilis TaxID=150966 RepID=A0AAD3XKK4_NEPGR|nr:hypothetical protein Nepgr_009684 [Nepenthes gracilis]